MATHTTTPRRSVAFMVAALALTSSVSATAQTPDEVAGTAMQETSSVPEDATALLAASVGADTAALEASAAAEAAPALFGGAAVSEDLLASTTGREQSGAMVANVKNTSNVSNNQVGDNNTTGDVNVSDAAFQNVRGISMVNFNTGNNSSMNAAMSVNIQINYAVPATAP